MKTLEYKLSQPVEYADQGEQVEGDVLVCTAPKGKNRKDATRIKQMFFRAMPSLDEFSDEQKEAAEQRKAESDNSESSDVEIDGGEVLFMIMQSTKVEYDEFIELGRKMISSGLCKVDGIKEVNSTVLDRLSVEELENLIGDYVAFFIVSSAMKSMQNST